MATYEEVQRLILETEGVPKLEEARQKLIGVEKAMGELNAARARGVVSTDAYVRELKNLEAQASRVAPALEKAASGLGGFKGNVTAAGYALNDFFSATGGLDQKLIAVSNNLPALLAGFGGLGLALSALVPIIATVIRNWDNLEKAFGEGAGEAVTQVERLEARIKELKAQPLTLEVDRKQLDDAEYQLGRLKAALAEFRKETPSGAARESGRQVADVLAEAEGGEGSVKRRLKERLVAENERTDPVIKQAEQEVKEQEGRVRDLLAMGATEQAGQAAELAQAARERVKTQKYILGQNAEGVVGDLFSRAKSGDAEAQAQLAASLRAIGRGGVAREVEGAGAESIAAGDEEERKFQAGLDRRREAVRRRNAREAERRKETERGQAETMREGERLAREGLAELGRGEKDRAKAEAARGRDAGREAEARAKAAAETILGQTTIGEQATAAALRMRGRGATDAQISQALTEQVGRMTGAPLGVNAAITEKVMGGLAAAQENVRLHGANAAMGAMLAAKVNAIQRQQAQAMRDYQRVIQELNGPTPWLPPGGAPGG